jgi:hypothetical protein
MNSSIILNGLLLSTTPTIHLASNSEFEIIKKQQARLEQKLLQQELINTNLYQSLLDLGLLQRKTTVSSLLDFQPSTSKGSSGVAATFIYEMFTSLGSVLEKLFGTGFWIYILIFLGIFMFLICFCTYLCCCCKLRSLSCCFKCLKKKTIVEK